MSTEADVNEALVHLTGLEVVRQHVQPDKVDQGDRPALGGVVLSHGEEQPLQVDQSLAVHV